MPVSDYGLMIALGLLCAGLVIWLLNKHFSLNFYDVLILLVYTIAFGIIGAKLAYLLLNVNQINWACITQREYFMALLRGGFIFYGGIPFGLAGLYLGGRIHHIHVSPYLRTCLPALPLVHGFGRIGCHLAGCCYGIPYGGPLAVIYRHTTLTAPLDIPLFPVQLTEAVAEFALFFLLLYLTLRFYGRKNLLPLYLLLYGLIRFCLEFLRGDAERGHWSMLSTSQWVSLLCILIAVLCFFICQRKSRTNPKLSA